MRREKSCAFTGHRPEKLPWGSCESDDRCYAVKQRLAQTLMQAYEDGYRHFISGMARGGDLYFAEAVLKLRAQRGDVTLEAAIPCPEQAERWSAEERARYDDILDLANFKTLVSPHYTRECMFQRNRYMVNKASLLIALYDGSAGGTRNTVLQAMKQELEVIIIDPDEGIKSVEIE